MIKKRAIYRLVAAWAVCMLVWQIFHQSRVVYVDKEQKPLDLSSIARHEALLGIKMHSGVYDEMLATYGLSTLFDDYDMDLRCNAFFNLAMKGGDSYFIRPDVDMAFSKEDFDSDDPAVWERIKNDERLLHDFFTNIRVFNKCYIERESNERQGFISRLSKNLWSSYSCKTLESRLFPWLTLKLPTYTDWNNRERTVGFLAKLKSKFSGECFLTQMKRGLKGKGIVMTLSDGHIDDAVRLIKVLRAMNNQLPIEIVYFTNLSPELKQRLIQVCRLEFAADGRQTPLQDIWFVDVNPAVQTKFMYKFDGFGNKILATFFNSFEEMILIDADAVVFKLPLFFFERPKYLEMGTLFYKDRLAVEYRPENDLVFFKKLLPSLMDSAFFDIPQTTSYTLDREFFQGSNHYMESGLVVINRQMHFALPLLMAQLAFHPPVQFRLYGDKELFWISQAMLGDEAYAFNDHFLAAIGFVTPPNEREISKYDSKEVCSNHPGHISDEDDHTLLWMNSGFRHCGNSHIVNFQAEFEVGKRYKNLKTVEEFEKFFKGKVVLRNAVIPPKKPLEADNLDDEPSRAWINMRDYCAGYTWCAYNTIGGRYEKDGQTLDNRTPGILITFTQEEIGNFERTGDIWLTEDSS